MGGPYRPVRRGADADDSFTDSMGANTDRHDNTSAAGIGLASEEGDRSGRLNSGDVVLLDGSRAGFAWGAVGMRRRGVEGLWSTD